MADLVGSDELPLHPEWEAIRSKHRHYEMLAINTGRAAGVPEVYLHRFAAEVVEREIRGGDYTFAADFMRNNTLGTPEAIAYFSELGKKQKEEKAAKKAESANMVSPGECIHLPSAETATMADLFRILRSSSQALQDRFEIDLEDQYDWKYQDFYTLEKDQEGAATLLVTEFFDEEAYDIETSLPRLKFGNEEGNQ